MSQYAIPVERMASSITNQMPTDSESILAGQATVPDVQGI